MTVEEINLLAYNGSDMPVNLNTAEQLLYLKLLYLYKFRSWQLAAKGKPKQFIAYPFNEHFGNSRNRLSIYYSWFLRLC